MDTSPGDARYDGRWDLVPGTRFASGNWIIINDLTALIAGVSGYPPMFGGGTKAFNGPACTRHPVYGN